MFTVPPSCNVVQADQWVLLSRAHALAVLALPDRVLSVTPASSSSSTSSSYDHTQFGGKRGSDHNALLKALFRQVPTQRNTTKHSLVFHSTPAFTHTYLVCPR